MWVALEKSDKGNGGVFYYNGSHKLGLLNIFHLTAKVLLKKLKV